MSSTEDDPGLTKLSQQIDEIKTILWGQILKEDVFQRWAQGFYFSPDEPTALVQVDGGPCAVIAPVQAFILKHMLCNYDVSTWSNFQTEECNKLLVGAMVEIVDQAKNTMNPRYWLLDLGDTLNGQGEDEPCISQDNAASSHVISCKNSKNLSTEMDIKSTLESQFFHSHLRLCTVTNSIQEVEQFFTDKINMFKDRFGVLILLYTVIGTKGINKVGLEMSDPTEPLIDSTYGYGSQSLINLMLTGRAVSHVWDYDQDVGGLKLQGIDKQNSVGFLALLEHLRYCEVGTFFKSPANPVWVLGSETHLTVLFSPEKKLVSPETPAEQAKRVFRKYDPEGNNFISANLLQDVLAELDLVADTEYVEIMTKKLDNEGLGIILLAAFMDEFFSEEPRTCPDTFVLYHYNGLPRSNLHDQVRYHKGQAVLLECSVKCILESNPMLTVLQTKWPSIEVQWNAGRTPSLN